MENIVVSVNDKDFDIHYLQDEYCCLIIGDKEYKIELLKKMGDDIYTFLVNQKIYQVEFDFDSENLSINLNGFSYDIKLKDNTRDLLQKFLTQSSKSNSSGAGVVKAPMPGKIIDVLVREGATVTRGEPVVILEAMKMQNEILAPVSGTIVKVSVKANTNVMKDDLLVEIKI